ncbi:MAG: YqgE/AlgH family protein, partial [Vicinamibacteria bacterium]
MMPRAGFFFVGLSLWLPSASAQPRRAVAPAPGVFLVAKPSIGGGPFHHSVVLLLAHGTEGTLGVIINRATEIPLDRVLPELEVKERESHSIQFGGPVALDGLLFLFKSDDPPEDVEGVMANVFFSGKRDLLEKLLKEESGDRLKLYLGHAGWAPGQLRGEIARGDWDLVPADAFTVFQK